MTRAPRRGARTPPPRATAVVEEPSGPARNVPRPWSAAVALVALAVYLAQAPPVSGDKDSAEFTLVLALNGVAHPTGYPLYTLLGHLFVRLAHALGATWPYAANAWTALGGGVAVYFLQRLALATVRPALPLGRAGRFLLSLVPVALFALNPVWTYETTLAEVYSWHVAWALGTATYFAWLTCALADEERWPPARLARHAALWGLLCGIGGAHHATALLVAAPLSIALLVAVARAGRLKPAFVPLVLGAACLPLLSYGIILWRGSHPAAFQWTALQPGLGGLLTHMSGRQYAVYFGHFSPSPQQRVILSHYVYPFLIPGALLALVPCLRARDALERAMLWGLLATIVLGAAYSFNYGSYDPSSYFLHAQAMALALLVPLLAPLAASGPAPRRAALATAVLLGGAGIVLWPAWLRTGRERVELFVSYDSFVHRMWSSIPMDSAVVFWSEDMVAKLHQYQLLEHEKPGITVVHGLTIYTPSVREEFVRRLGFDPVAGILIAPHTATPAGRDSLQREAVDSVEARVNRVSHLPVIHFDPDPAKPTMRLLLKPGMGRPVP
jgi:hypothetical protein